MRRTNFFCSVLGLIFWGWVAGAQVITTAVGTDWTFPATPLPGINAPLGNLSGLGVDADGNAYAVDEGNSTVVRIAPDGTLTVVAGNGVRAYSGDGGAVTSASLNLYPVPDIPFGIAVGPDGSVYIADTGNYAVRQVTPDGRIATIAGISTPGISESGQIFVPVGLALDGAGNLFIGYSNEGFVRIPRISTDGTITTVANNVVGYGGLAADSAGNLCIPEDSGVIQELTPGGTVSVAATLAVQFAGQGYLTGIAVDANGNLFVCTYGNGSPNGVDGVLKITPAG